MRIGSLFSGYGGLDLAVAAHYGATVAWHVECDKWPSAILAHHYPDVPNYGDITAVDWSAVEPVDIITGGFPCQDVSHAGLRAGVHQGTRSGLWFEMARAIDVLKPWKVVIENVAGLLSADAASTVEPCPWCVGDEPASTMRALGAVLADLAEMGFDAEWGSVRASDAGAPHGRLRVFILATDATRDAVNDMGAGKTPQDWDDWTQAMRAKHGNGNGHGKSLEIEAQRLLPTPKATNNENRQNLDRYGMNIGQALGITPLIEGEEDAMQRGGVRPEVARSDVLFDALQEVEFDGEPVGDEDGRPSTANANGTLLAACAEDPDLLALDRGTGEQVRARKVHGEAQKLQGASLGLRGDCGTDPDRSNTGSPVSSSCMCEPGAPRACDAIGECAASKCGEDTLPTGAPTERRQPIPEPAGIAGVPGMPQRSVTTAPGQAAQWGPYQLAIERWSQIIGRPAPPPTEPGQNGRPRLSPRFVEFMMGLPDGWVTGVDIPRNAQLKALGNGVVPQQAALALELLDGA